jgi:Uncharacterized protein conserved in bacteria (DUF2066)
MPSARWFFTLFVMLLAMATGGASAQVAGSNTYTISGVDVDATGPDAIQARQQAIRQAQQKAVKLLIERMVAPEDRAKVPPLDPSRVDGMIRGVEFANERSSANRYVGTLNVVFSAEPVNAWLREGGISVAETVARPALVVPLWKGKAGVEALDERSPWRDAWRGLDTAGSAVPVTLVRGDQLDQNALSVEEAYVGDVAALSRLNERYHAPTIIVATLEGDKSSGALTAGGVRYDTQTGARSELPRITVPDANQLADAVKKIHAKLDEDWRSIAVVRRDSQAGLDVVVPIRQLSDWVQIRQRLGAVPAVKSVTVRALESERAELHLEYFGTQDQLQRTLAQAGLQLDKDADQWRLQAR